MRPSEKAINKVIQWAQKSGVVAYKDPSNPFHLNTYQTHLGRIEGPKKVFVVYTNEGWKTGQPSEFLIDAVHKANNRGVIALNEDESRIAVSFEYETNPHIKYINGRAFIDCINYGVYEL